jgi:hypothetical protein
MDDLDYAQLDPGIRKLVRFLREHAFDTSDSGDGRSKPETARVVDLPHVMMLVERELLFIEADRLHDLLDARGVAFEEEGAPLIEATYNPADGLVTLMLVGLDDTALHFED